MLEQNTRESAVRREEFHGLLRTWLDDSVEKQVGDPDGHAGSAWLWVRHGGDRFYLDACSSREGVRRYMQMVQEADGDPAWSFRAVGDEADERVAVGGRGSFIDGFEFYRHVAER